MTKFDNDTWHKNALGRNAAAKSRGQKYPLSRDVTAIQALTVVMDWCDARKITVDFVMKGGEYYIPDEKKITVSARARPETQLFTLLHECGHYLVHACSQNSKRFAPHAQKGPFAGPAKDLTHRVDSVEEEYEAWHRGSKLASRLGIELNQERFEATKVTCIKTHFKWALKPGRFFDD